MNNSNNKTDSLSVKILPLVENILLPRPASAKIRSTIPRGYGIQEQCLPFTAACSLGLLIGSPITFGFCLPAELPEDVISFRSPIVRPNNGEIDDLRIFYVKNDKDSQFDGNAFTYSEQNSIAANRGQNQRDPHPGISFFDRQDQTHLFKIHLPYICKTPTGIDALILPPINRATLGFSVKSGLVEADWYSHPVNLVLEITSKNLPIHVAKGDPISQIIFVNREHRRLNFEVLASHKRAARDIRSNLSDWYKSHAADRNAYKRLVRSQCGHIKKENNP